VPHYARVRYQDVYPGVDFVFYGQDRELEYDVVLRPGADPRAVALKVEGADSLSLDGAGDLVLQAAGAELRQLRPVVYQQTGGERRSVEARYVLLGPDRIGFQVEPYDSAQPLFIDPVLRFSSYLGGSGYEYATAVKVDAAGFLYVGGDTYSTDFPQSGGAQAGNNGSRDAFLTKIAPDGSAIVYSTYLGGGLDEHLARIAVDGAGNVFLTGNTNSPDFPTINGFQTTPGSPSYYSDAFVSELDATGSSFVFSTYLGGNSTDSATGIAVDGSGTVRVAGFTRSTNFPGTFLSFGFYDRSDIFVSSFSSSGSFLGTRAYGGIYTEGATDIAVDPAGSMYVTGFYNTGGAPSYYGGFAGPYRGGCFYNFSYLYCGDSFVMKLDPSGNLVYSTSLGGDGDDIILAVAVDADGDVHAGGTSNSSSLDLVNPIQSTGPGFLWKLEPSGATAYATRFGGGVNGVALDADHNVYLAGNAGTELVPVNAFQDLSGNDAFVAKIDASGSSVLYATPVGGPGYDLGQAVAVDAAGNAYLAGQTGGDFPIIGGFQISPAAGSTDAFVAKIGSGDNVVLGSSRYYVSEAEGQLEVSVLRSDAAAGVPVTVAYATTSGSASAFFDYTPTSGTLTFAPGETRKSFVIPILDDSVVEGDETFQVSITVQDPDGGVAVGHIGTALVTIYDGDSPPPVGTATQSFVVRDRVRATGPSWSASADVPWLSLSPTSGTGPTTVSVSADPAGLAPGSYVGTITVTAAAQDSPQQVQVSLEVGTHLSTTPEALEVRSDDPAATGRISLVAGGGSGGDGGPAVDASLTHPTSLAVDGSGNVYIADHEARKVRKVASDGTISTFAGTGNQGFGGDGGLATDADLDDVNGVAADAAGNVYISDMSQHRVRRVDGSGIITTVAGNGSAGFSGDGGAATDAQLNAPVGMAFDAAGNMYIADAANNRIRKVDTGGVITTVAGDGNAGWTGDGEALTRSLNFPVSLAVDAEGTLYIADVGNNLVRQLTLDGQLQTVAGGQVSECGSFQPLAGFGGDGVAAWGSALNEPSGVAVNAKGELLIADTGNHRIRKVVGGGIYTVAGNGTPGYSGDGGAAAAASLASPWWVATDNAGNVYIADTDNQRVRRVEAQASFAGVAFDVSGIDGWTLGDWQLTSDVPWLTFAPAAGSGPGTVRALADSTGLDPGVHTATLTISTDEGLVQRTVSLTLTVASPGIAAEPAALFLFDELSGGGERPAGGAAPSGPTREPSVVAGRTRTRTIRIFDPQDPSGPHNWQISTDADWLSVSETSGSGPATITVTGSGDFGMPNVSPATLTISSDGVDVPLVIPVFLEIRGCFG